MDFGERAPGSISFTAEALSERNPADALRVSLRPTLRGLSCAPNNHLLWVELNPRTLVTSVMTTVEVNRAASYQQARRSARLVRNAPLFFKKSEICHLQDGDFSTVPNPTKTGNANYRELLLEQVSIGFSPGFPIDSVNVLNVDCASARKPHRGFQCRYTRASRWSMA